jgi:choline dehydrogenase-like flavoprotein
VTERTCDYVIVGAGSAGCVVANRLSADGRHSVLLLEAGPPDTNPWIHIPIGCAKTMFHPTLDWRFHTEPEPQMHGREVYWPRGRTLGGSSSINGLICIRGRREDCDGWAALGNPGWSFEDALPWFRALEHNVRGASAHRGTGGPLRASDIVTRHPLVEAPIGAANELGIPRNHDFDGAAQEGAGHYQLATRRGPAPAGAGRGFRRRPARLRPRHRRHDLPSGRHHEDGPGAGSAGGGRRRAARARLRRPARRRLRHHADVDVRQHRRAGRDDRREGRRPDPAHGARRPRNLRRRRWAAATPISRW